ncbi:AAA family ATPase [Blastococcus sp. SYSU DS0616]
MTAPKSVGHTAQAMLDELVSAVDLAAPSTTKFSRLETWLASLMGLSADDVVVATISKAGNFSVRANQSQRARSAAVFVGVVPEAGEVPATRRAATARVEAGLSPSVLLIVRGSGGTWDASWGVMERHADSQPFEALHDALGTEAEKVEGRVVDQSIAGSVPPPTLPGSVPVTRLALDPRTRRMLRRAVASRPAVMLVGPPGTGKSQLVSELLADVAADPSVVGMVTGHEATLVTPDESWTARELVGGETIDDQGRLRFVPGAVLRAITEDRWLVLDEANRADLDRVFGPLLTWLSGQPVQVGRTSGEPDAGPITLGWGEAAQCAVLGAENLRSDSPGPEPVQYLAGSDWRLLGTYNALDAHRVFKFGLALGRRFAHVPVGAPDTEGFRAALAGRLSVLPERLQEQVSESLTAIYDAHREIEGAVLGPAAFLEIPTYLAGEEPGSPNGTELLAEGYVSAVGTWLARLEEEQLDALGVRLAAEDVLGAQWEWVRSQLTALR